MLKSVRLKLTLLYIASICVVVLLFGVIAFLSLQAILMRGIDEALYNGGKILEESLSEYTLADPDDIRSLYEPSDEDGETDEFFIDEIDEEVNEIFYVNLAYVQLQSFEASFETAPRLAAKTETLEDLLLPLSQDAYRGIQEAPFFYETVKGVFSFPLRLLSLRVEDRDGRPHILQLALSVQDMQTTRRDLLNIFAVLFPVLLVFVAVLGYVFMKRAFSPIKKMVTVSKKITAEDLSLRLESLDSRDEIGELSETLNEMIIRLERSFNQIRQFSGDVSHELKTPLSHLKLHAEVTLRRERTKQEYQHVLAGVIEDTENLQKIIEDLLFLARLDTQSIPLQFKTLELNEVLLAVFEDTQPMAKAKSLSLGFAEIDQTHMKGDVGLIKRLLTNLVMNTIRYTPSGGKIVFSLQKDTDHAVVTIADTGIGIPQAALPFIFDRFYRVDSSRSAESGGAGLGLSIAQKIVEVHGGQIKVDSELGKGTVFRVTLPCLS